MRKCCVDSVRFKRCSHTLRNVFAFATSRDGRLCLIAPHSRLNCNFVPSGQVRAGYTAVPDPIRTMTQQDAIAFMQQAKLYAERNLQVRLYIGTESLGLCLDQIDGSLSVLRHMRSQCTWDHTRSHTHGPHLNWSIQVSKVFVILLNSSMIISAGSEWRS